MASGFVSGGSLEAPVERDDEWKQAQKELDAERARKAGIEADRGGKSLFEVLQANKGDTITDKVMRRGMLADDLG